MTVEALQPADVIDQVAKAIEQADEDLHSLNQEIFNNPETAFQEVKACKLLSDWFERRGWQVSREVYGVSTAFEARFSIKEGGRTVCFNAEYDALPGVGHACGHNLIATSSIASAIGVEAVMKARNLPGTLILMGTPAEESSGGKWIMAKNGAWRDVDACVMTHPMPTFSTPMCCTKASWKLKAQFRGFTAHAATAPFNGKNACDAIVQAYTGIALLRQHTHKGESIQGCILEAGKAANLIPDFSEGLFSVRAPTIRQADALKRRVEAVFQGAADATGCTVELDWFALYENVVSNETLAEQYRQYMIQCLGLTPDKMRPIEEAKTAHDQPGSSDFGSCSHICPGIQAMFEINASDLPHSIGFRKASEGEYAYTEAIRAGKANALICLDVLMNDTFAARMKEEFIEAMKEAGRWPEGSCN